MDVTLGRGVMLPTCWMSKCSHSHGILCFPVCGTWFIFYFAFTSEQFQTFYLFSSIRKFIFYCPCFLSFVFQLLFFVYSRKISQTALPTPPEPLDPHVPPTKTHRNAPAPPDLRLSAVSKLRLLHHSGPAPKLSALFLYECLAGGGGDDVYGLLFSCLHFHG